MHAILYVICFATKVTNMNTAALIPNSMSSLRTFVGNNLFKRFLVASSGAKDRILRAQKYIWQILTGRLNNTMPKNSNKQVWSNCNIGTVPVNTPTISRHHAQPAVKFAASDEAAQIHHAPSMEACLGYKSKMIFKIF